MKYYTKEAIIRSASDPSVLDTPTELYRAEYEKVLPGLTKKYLSTYEACDGFRDCYLLSFETGSRALGGTPYFRIILINDKNTVILTYTGIRSVSIDYSPDINMRGNNDKVAYDEMLPDENGLLSHEFILHSFSTVRVIFKGIAVERKRN